MDIPCFGEPMTWTVYLINELGEQIEPSAAGDDVVLRRAQSAGEPLPLLNLIDPYGDTYWNGLQAPAFLMEWQRLREVADGPLEQRFVDDVERLATRCRDGTHTYLKFVGD